MFERIKLIIGFLAFTLFGSYLIYTNFRELLYANVLDYNSFKQAVTENKVSTLYLLNNKSWFTKMIGRRRWARLKQTETIIEDLKDLELFANEHNIKLIKNPSYFNIYAGTFDSILRFLMGIFFLIMGIIMLVSLIYFRRMNHEKLKNID